MQVRNRDLSNKLKELLGPSSISTSSTDIFEETLLKAAGVATQPTLCKFGSDDEEDKVLYFKFRGISEVEAEQFLKFLQETSGDASASREFVPALGAELTAGDDDVRDVHYFKVDQKMACDKLFNLFAEKFRNLEAEKIQYYQNLSKPKPGMSFLDLMQLLQANNEPDSDMLALAKQLDDIMRLSAEVQSEAVDEYTRGQLSIILNLMLDPALDAYNNCGHKQHGCDGEKSSMADVASATVKVSGLLATAIEGNGVLQANEKVKALQDNLTSFRANAPQLSQSGNQRGMNGGQLAQLLGLFSGMAGGASSGLRRSNDSGSASPDGLRRSHDSTSSSESDNDAAPAPTVRVVRIG